ncbi:MAG TPA: hypothetical protein VE961_14235 [Pyrinomonadaceae bacterium]|nr:hypothetical protein [Pyrinomonadaceae bacterium]
MSTNKHWARLFQGGALPDGQQPKQGENMQPEQQFNLEREIMETGALEANSVVTDLPNIPVREVNMLDAQATHTDTGVDVVVDIDVDIDEDIFSVVDVDIDVDIDVETHVDVDQDQK